MRVFEYLDYKNYLNSALPNSKQSRGQRAALARYLKCQNAYVSQILRGPGHFSLEHSALISEFLEHTLEERRFFLLLVQHARSGSVKLANIFQIQIDEILRLRKKISKRLGIKNMELEKFQGTYYSAWHYSAIHILLMIPRYQSRIALAQYLKIPASTITETCDFLLRSNLAEEDKDKIRATNKRVHLGTDSPFFAAHHVNWMLKIISYIEKKSDENLFFSGPVAISKEGAEKIKTILLNSIEKMEPIIANSAEEEAFAICIDFCRI